jgi:hypothetical protein
MRAEATMSVNGGPRRAEVKRADTYRTVPRQTTVHTELAVADKQLESLGGDMFALKMLLPALLSRVGRLDPILASAIRHGFQDATNQVEHLMAESRKAKTHDRCRNALASIKTIRDAVLTELSSPLVTPDRHRLGRDD